MSGRVKAAFSFLLLLFPQLVDAQCNFTPRSSGQFRATMLDLAVDGSDLWAATGYGVQLLDRTVDPPLPVASVALPDTTRVVRTGGSGLVYAGSGSRLYVLRKNGRSIEIVRNVNVGATINDIAVASALFAATSNGIAHFTLVDPTNPTRTNATLATSSANVTSLSIAGSSVYAADGDASVEIFNISLPSQPQRTGSLDSLPRSIAVHATSSRVYVSDGQNTDIFVSGTRVARTPFGSTSFAPIGTDEHFVAGTALSIHAVDFSVGSNPVELFEQQLAPTPGTANRVSAMQLSGNRLYVAAGDAGIATFDVSSFTKPYPVRSIAGGATTSALLIGATAYVTPSSGGISEYSTSGNFLTFSKSHDTDRAWTLVDRFGTSYLAVSGARALLSNGQSSGYAINFPKTILSAASDGATIWAVLADEPTTLWSVATVTDATPQQISTTIKPVLISRSGSAIALSEVSGLNTNIHYFADHDFSKTPRTFTVPGAPIGNVALSATTIAIDTYQGVTLIDIASGNASVLPDSGALLAKQLVFSGTKLLELTDRSLLVWDVAARRLSREILLPADSIGLDADASLAVISTFDGVTTASFNAAQQLPQLQAIRNSNRYYTKVVASDDRLYTFGENGIDIYATTIGDTPLFTAGIRANGFVDLAASDDFLFTLAGNGTVTAYGRDGNAILQATISEGAESHALGIASVGGAPWVSLATNCNAGSCRDKKTFVLDPLTLAVTSTMTGGVIDVVTSGARAYALVDSPSEVRVFSIADTRHPAQTAARALTTTANSVAYSSGVVYVAGANVQTFDETALNPSSKTLTPIASDAIDRIRFDGSCAILTHRTFAPELIGTTSTALALPSAVRSIATQPGRIWFLTDTSIEVWSSIAPVKPSKRRPSK